MMASEIATFAAGCFWGVEANFQKLPGVTYTVVGYTGGKVENPTYQMVCTNKTGHAEVVRVSFDPEQITYEDLVKAFFDMHDPTTPNRQGADVGTQYRSAIFYHNEEQHQIAERVKTELGKSCKYRYPIVTEITPSETFYKAEDYHQNYYIKHYSRRM